MKTYKPLIICLTSFITSVIGALKPAAIITALLTILSLIGCLKLSWGTILFAPFILMIILSIIKTAFFVLLYKVIDTIDRRCR